MRVPMIRDREFGLLLAAFERCASVERCCAVDRRHAGHRQTRLLEEFVREWRTTRSSAEPLFMYGDGITSGRPPRPYRPRASRPATCARGAGKLASLLGPDDEAAGSIARMIGLSAGEATQGEAARHAPLRSSPPTVRWCGRQDLHWAEPKMKGSY
jgi:hypothetical protein